MALRKRPELEPKLKSPGEPFLVGVLRPNGPAFPAKDGRKAEGLAAAKLPNNEELAGFHEAAPPNSEGVGTVGAVTEGAGGAVVANALASRPPSAKSCAKGGGGGPLGTNPCRLSVVVLAVPGVAAEVEAEVEAGAEKIPGCPNTGF